MLARYPHSPTTDIIANAPQVGRDGNVFSFGSSFYNGDIPAAPPSLGKRDTAKPVDALKSAVDVYETPMYDLRVRHTLTSYTNI
jgi:hypothetical protein